MVDGVGELGAVAGAAARVGIEHHVFVGGVFLEGEVETAVVHAVRAAVDDEHHRVDAGRVEVRRLHDPALDAEAILRVVPDLLHFTEFDVRQHVGVHVGEAAGFVRAVEVEAVDVARVVGAGDDPDAHAVVRERRQAEEMLTRRELRHPAVHGYEVELRVAVAAHVEVEPAAVARPHHAPDLPVVVPGDDARAGTIAVHQMDLLVAVGVAVGVDPGIGDEQAVG